MDEVAFSFRLNPPDIPISCHSAQPVLRRWATPESRLPTEGQQLLTVGKQSAVSLVQRNLFGGRGGWGAVNFGVMATADHEASWEENRGML